MYSMCVCVTRKQTKKEKRQVSAWNKDFVDD